MTKEYSLADVIARGGKLTPMMEQYWAIKKNLDDVLLFFRMGDFYELFFDDARMASRLLNITLTHRGKLGDIPIPMAGIPFHSAVAYVDRLTAKGMKVAICEQVEDPKEAKGIVRREVVQIVSPGMPFDLEKTDVREARFMATTYSGKNNVYLVCLDFTTGEFVGHALKNEQELLDKIRLYAPKEVLLYKGQWEDSSAFMQYLNEQEVLKTYFAKDYFSLKTGLLYVQKLIPSFERDQILKSYPEIANAIAVLGYYVSSTQSIQEFFHIRPFRLENDSTLMRASLSTLKGLEILPKSKETYYESLLGLMDKTCTSMGTRYLRRKFMLPTRDIVLLNEEYSLLKTLLEGEEKDRLLQKIREELQDIRDVERIMAKVSSQKVSSQDLLNLALTVETYQKLKKILKPIHSQHLKMMNEKDGKILQVLGENIRQNINDEIGAHLEKGNLIKEGASKERDKLARLGKNSADVLLAMESQYREKTGISNLKVRYNNIAGYFIEVSKSHLHKVPKNFERRQTLVNSERFITKELREYEQEALSAKERLEELEKKIFNDVVSKVAESANLFLQLADSLGSLDVYQSFAFVALQEDFTMPQIRIKEKGIKITGGRHPLIKSLLRDQFVEHQFALGSPHHFALITGPNMAGKTTVMREVAIIQFLTQIGSFVPARKAELSLCDYLFSRLGASDDIMKGQSTFMVEMAEMAEILRHATENSLIIVDEVGRGTSTYDGLSLAWAILEHLVQKTKALTLFSTHYHELIHVVDKLAGAKNYSVATSVKDGQVHFLYQLQEKGAEESYGIYVAKLAGLPLAVLRRSEEILGVLEHKQEQQEFKFAPKERDDKTEVVEKFLLLEEDLSQLDVLNMTPLQAIEKLHQIQKNFTTL